MELTSLVLSGLLWSSLVLSFLPGLRVGCLVSSRFVVSSLLVVFLVSLHCLVCLVFLSLFVFVFVFAFFLSCLVLPCLALPCLVFFSCLLVLFNDLVLLSCLVALFCLLILPSCLVFLLCLLVWSCLVMCVVRDKPYLRGLPCPLYRWISQNHRPVLSHLSPHRLAVHKGRKGRGGGSQDRDRQKDKNEARQDKTRQDKTRRGKTRQDKIRHDKTTLDWTGGQD